MSLSCVAALALPAVLVAEFVPALASEDEDDGMPRRRAYASAALPAEEVVEQLAAVLERMPSQERVNPET